MQIPVVSCQASSALPSWRGQAEGKASAWQCLEQGPALPAGGGGRRKGREQLHALWGESPNRKAHTHTLQAVTQNVQSGTTLSSKDTCLLSPF